MTPDALKQQLASLLERPTASSWMPLELPGDWFERRLLVALAEHTRRQRWVTQIVQDRLGANVRQLSEFGSGGHPTHIRDRGRVPGLPDWRYYFHGRGCCLSHTDGTEIDVNFDLQGGDRIDCYFFAHYLESIPVSAGVDALLLRPQPFSRIWMADLDGLVEQGWLDDAHWGRLTEAGTRWAEALAPAMAHMASSTGERRRYLALLLQDFEAMAGGEPLSTEESARHLALRETRAARLERRAQEGRDRYALHALAWLAPDRAQEQVRRVLARAQLDGLTSSALDLVAHWGASAFEPLLLELARRAHANQAPDPFVRARALALVMCAYRCEEIPEELHRVLLELTHAEGHYSEGSVAFLHALLAPSQGLRRLGRTLVHPVPIARQEAAEFLGILALWKTGQALQKIIPVKDPPLRITDAGSLGGLLRPLLLRWCN